MCVCGCATVCDNTSLCPQQLWDFVRVIESCIVDWHATPWQRIDTDDVEHECKKFTRDLRTLDKCIRDWAPYVYIVAVLRELVASLRAVTELQNPAITERHWLELMQLAKVREAGVAIGAAVANYCSVRPLNGICQSSASALPGISFRQIHLIGLHLII